MNAAAAAEILTAEPITSAPAVPKPLMTFEQWANMDEDEPGEFVDGKLVEDEVPSVKHEIVVSWLIGALRGWGQPRDCQVFGSELKLRVARTRGRKPDVSMYAEGTRFRDAAFLRKPPMLIVEVVSRQPRDVKRDRLEKRQEYATFGVQHYWLVDPNARIFEFLTLGSNGRWIDATDSASEGRIEIAGFDGLVLDLDELWRQVDSIIEEDADEIIEGDEV
jgi:Uma2 family endonuclease